MKVLMAAVDGCGKSRCEFPARALQAEGYDVELVAPDDDAAQIHGTYHEKDGEFRWLTLDEPDCDVIVLQRPLDRFKYFATLELQARGYRVVVEIDDDFEVADRRNHVWAYIQPRNNPNYNKDWLRRTAQVADLVTVTTPALAARYGKHGRVAVLPNYVPERYLDEKRLPHDGIDIGWTGTAASHPGDLDVVGDGVARALHDTTARFRVVGDSLGVGRALRLDDDPDHTGWLPHDAYVTAMAQLDVGIVPLAPTAFNRGKSALKLLEFSALGVPTVVSPTPDNQRVGYDVGAFFARTSGQWAKELTRLVTHDGYRRRAAECAREGARNHTYEKHCHLWWEAWSRCLE